jgi:hypothetical protein
MDAHEISFSVSRQRDADRRADAGTGRAALPFFLPWV